MGDRRRTALRWTTVVVSFLAACGYNQSSATVIYLNAFKEQFNLTQAQADLLQASSGLGLVFMFPGGFLVHQFGYRSSCVLGAVLCVVGYTMLWLSMYSVQFYIAYPYFMHLYFFVAGTGCALVYVASTDAVVKLFRIKAISQVMMLLAVSLNAGVAVYILIYNIFFYGDGTPLDQNLGGYFLFLAASTLGLHIVVYITYKLHDTIPVVAKEDYESLDATNPEKNPEQEMVCPADSTDKSNNFRNRSDSGRYSDVDMDVPSAKKALRVFDEYTKLIRKPSLEDLKDGDDIHTKDVADNTEEPHDKDVQTVPEPNEKRSLGKINRMFTSYKFHMLFWPALTVTCLRLVCVTNLETFLLSFRIQRYPQIIFYISPVMSITMKLSMSALFHLFSHRVPRVGLVTGGAVLSMASFSLALYQININVLIILVVSWTLAGGLSLSLLPAIFASQFGKETSPVSLGTIHAGKAILQMALQGLYGSLYDIQIIDGGKTCYGDECFNIFFITAVILSGLCLVLLLGYMYLQRRESSSE